MPFLLVECQQCLATYGSGQKWPPIVFFWPMLSQVFSVEHLFAPPLVIFSDEFDNSKTGRTALK
jgi:hypothetical protein